jgi:purine catabolism regulator
LEYTLTVGEVLKRPLFNGATVVAGHNGLDRRVRWVHILEIMTIEQLINGEELILTTGVAFKSDLSSFVSYLEQLVKRNVSGLCIELGQFIDHIPEEMITLADSHGLPLIIFPQTVRFVDITQDLHVLIINKHHKVLQNLEGISREFHRLTLSSQGVTNVLKLLQGSTKAQIVYIPVQGQPIFIPSLPLADQTKLQDYIKTKQGEIPETDKHAAPYMWDYENDTLIMQPVGAMGKTWAFVAMHLTHKPQEYEFLILDSASLSIAQDLLRKRYIQERKLYAENLWVDDLLHRRIVDEEQIKSLVGREHKKLNESGFNVCLLEFVTSPEQKINAADDDGPESIGLHVSMMLRSLFEQHDFLPLITLKNNRLIVIAIDVQRILPSKSKLRLEQIFRTLQLMNHDEKIGAFQLLIGIGRRYCNLINTHLSYHEAIQAISLFPSMKQNPLFFDDLGVMQLLFNISDPSQLQSFVTNYLGKLIEYDESKGSDLVWTLYIYLDNDQSKQIAAQKLFIVRQSLYYRLGKIMELLGEGCMLPENRLALQVALRAYQMLNPAIWEQKKA